MRSINIILVVLLAGMLGCADDNLISVEVEEPEAATEAVAETDLWLEVAQAVSLDRETMHKTLAGGDMVLQMGKVTYYPDPAYDVMLNCLDADGNLVTGVSLPLRFLVEGRMQYLGWITGYFGGGSCRVNQDFTLTVDREWRYIGEGGHSIWGTYTLTTQADGSWTSRDVITGGIGKFAGATGLGRSVGRLDTPTVYSMGLVTAPKNVSSTGYVFETEPRSSIRMGEIACKDRRGNTTISGTRQIQSRVLNTYGWFDLFVTNDRCIDDGDIVTFFGTWSHTNAQGDALRGIHTVVVGIDEPWPNILIVTEGEGRFRNATGWLNGRVYWDERRDEGEGVIFLPR